MAISLYKTKKGENRYRVTIWKNNKVLKSKYFKRKLDAVEWEKREGVKLADEQVGRIKGINITVYDFFEEVYWPNKNIRESSASDYRRIFEKKIFPVFGKRKIACIDSEEWAGFIQKLLDSGTSKSRANRIHAAASAVYKLAFMWKYVDVNPLKRVQWFKEDLKGIDFWTEDETYRFLSWARGTTFSRFVLYLTAYETGMRVSEIIALKRDCLDLARGIITIRRSWSKITKKFQDTTKSGHKRVIGINPGLVLELERYLKTHDSEYVFNHSTFGHYTYSMIFGQFKRDQKSANVRSIGIHTIRHTFASHFVMRGGSIYDLKAVMGHSSIETTMRYAHLSPKYLRDQAELVSLEKLDQSNVIKLKMAE